MSFLRITSLIFAHTYGFQVTDGLINWIFLEFNIHHKHYLTYIGGHTERDIFLYTAVAPYHG